MTNTRKLTMLPGGPTLETRRVGWVQPYPDASWVEYTTQDAYMEEPYPRAIIPYPYSGTNQYELSPWPDDGFVKIIDLPGTLWEFFLDVGYRVYQYGFGVGRSRGTEYTLDVVAYGDYNQRLDCRVEGVRKALIPHSSLQNPGKKVFGISFDGSLSQLEIKWMLNDGVIPDSPLEVVHTTVVDWSARSSDYVFPSRVHRAGSHRCYLQRVTARSFLPPVPSP